MSNAQLFIHPAERKPVKHPKTGDLCEPWTFTYVAEKIDGSTEAVTSDSWMRYVEPTTRDRAIKIATTTYDWIRDEKGKPLFTILDKPWVSEKKVASGKALAASNAAKKVTVVSAVYTDEHGTPLVCKFAGCDNHIQKTGKKGRPPAMCEEHRGVVAAVTTDLGFYAVPCNICNKPIAKTGRKGRPPAAHADCKTGVPAKAAVVTPKATPAKAKGKPKVEKPKAQKPVESAAKKAVAQAKGRSADATALLKIRFGI